MPRLFKCNFLTDAPNDRALFLYKGGGGMSNPRYSNGNLRRKNRARFKAMDAPCGICGGKLGRIHYEEPSDAKHPLSFVIDEIKPVSKWQAFGYVSAKAAAEDWDNLQAAHYICNAMKSDKVASERIMPHKKINISDGDW
jgi:hypothetical protein